MGRTLARYLSHPARQSTDAAELPLAVLAAAIRPADVVLVDGHTRVSTAIKYLTQSSWSHAALFVRDPETSPDEPSLLEADVEQGVIVVPLRKYAGHRLRICRPSGLTDSDRQAVIANALARVGQSYDLRNVIDLARYLLPIPPVPTRLRRRMLALGSGDPTRAICSTLIAQAFQSVRYPILPQIERRANGECDDCVDEVLHIRHHSLFAPRDFDLSPFFEVVKPKLTQDFDYRALQWHSGSTVAVADGSTFASTEGANRRDDGNNATGVVR